MDHNFDFILYVYVGVRFIPVHVSHEEFTKVIDEYNRKYGINRVPYEHEYDDFTASGYLIESDDKTVGFVCEYIYKE